MTSRGSGQDEHWHAQAFDLLVTTAQDSNPPPLLSRPRSRTPNLPGRDPASHRCPFTPQLTAATARLHPRPGGNFRVANIPDRFVAAQAAAAAPQPGGPQLLVVHGAVAGDTAGRYLVGDRPIATPPRSGPAPRQSGGGWTSKSVFAPAPTRSRPILLACGPHDWHTIGTECLAMLLRYQGWPCRLLGA